jgi:anti-sigma factor RsiW
MEHAEIREKVLLLRDGELPESERLAVAEHLLACPSCRELHAAAGRIGAQFFGVPEPPASEGFVRGVMAGIGISAEPEDSEDEADLPLRWWAPVFSFGLAAALLLGAFPRPRRVLTLESLFAARAGVSTERTQDEKISYLADLLAVPLEGR